MLKVKLKKNVVYAGVRHNAGETIEIRVASYERMLKRGEIEPQDNGGKTNDK